jgi:hypothetical protein
MAPNATSSPKATFNPVGKTFPQRLDAFVADAKASHDLTVRRDSGRTAEWQQRLHICHMFLYNKYLATNPAKHRHGETHDLLGAPVEPENGMGDRRVHRYPAHQCRRDSRQGWRGVGEGVRA